MRGRRHPEHIKAQAIALRQAGRSLQEIVETLRVPKITVQGWVRHVVLTEAQQLQLRAKYLESGARGRPLAVIAWRKKIEMWKHSVREQINQRTTTLPFTDSDVGKLTLGLLYICEGAKYPSTQGMSFANTDPKMIKLFLVLLRRHFLVDEKKFRVRVMHRWDQDGEALRRFWSEITGVPLAQFHPAYADRRTKDQPTRRANYHGVCNLQYPSTTLQFSLQAIGESVLNAVEEPETMAGQTDPGAGVVSEAVVPGYWAFGFSEQ